MIRAVSFGAAFACAQGVAATRSIIPAGVWFAAHRRQRAVHRWL